MSSPNLSPSFAQVRKLSSEGQVKTSEHEEQLEASATSSAGLEQSWSGCQSLFGGKSLCRTFQIQKDPCPERPGCYRGGVSNTRPHNLAPLLPH